MDTFVTITQFDSLKEIEDKKDLFNSLTYRERKISDTKQLELTGMNVNDFYEFMKNNYTGNDPVNTNVDDVLNEDSLINKYNKTKFHNTIIDKKIDYYEKELDKANNSDNTTFKALPSMIKYKGDKILSKKHYTYLLDDNIQYLRTLKKLNQNENTTIDKFIVQQANIIIRLHIDKEDKIKLLNALISDCENIIMSYDISISYMYGEKSKLETGIKKLGEIVVKNILGYVLGFVNGIVSYIVKRSNNRMMIKIRSSTNPKDEMIKYRDTMENTLEILKTKKNLLEKENTQDN